MSFWDTGTQRTPTPSPDRCLVQARNGLEPENRNEVGDHEGTTRSERTLPRKASVKGRHCLLTTGGLIGVGRRALRHLLDCRKLSGQRDRTREVGGLRAPELR